MKKGPENQVVKKIARELEKASSKNDVAIWRSVSERICKPARLSVGVNVGKINDLTKKGEVVLVPGKVLGTGVLDHAVSVAALKFSESAKGKIASAGGKCLGLLELVNSNPKGSGVRVLC
ncbi:50S ribosomal protein L18e [Candidatus Micrarchaeota archaeon]|nr:50S ribosomal protein L18e [Candidatus Micrarchaeota archaeon]